MVKLARSLFWSSAITCIGSPQTLRRRQDLPSISLPVLATTQNVESDKVFFSYGRRPLLIGNDGSADKGGIHVFDFQEASNGRIPESYSKVTGRTKVVSAVYGVGDEDYFVTFSTPEHFLRFYEISSGQEIIAATKFILAEFSALCSWRSPVTNAVYIYLFGKKEVRMYLLKENKYAFEAVEVVSFPLPIEAETCASPAGESIIMFGGKDKKIYTFPASDVPSVPKVTVAVETEEEIVGAAIYHSTSKEYFYLVAFEEEILVYSKDFQSIVTVTIGAGEGLELSDIAIYQESKNAKAGYIGYAFESDDAGKAFGLSPLEPIFSPTKIHKNTKWSPVPKTSTVKFPKCASLENCNNGGICTSQKACKCYTGFTAPSCSQITCPNNCSGPKNGKCIAANTCRCISPFTGPDCSTLSVKAKYETEASGADGDDPAIWIAPTPSKSRIITTTKSEDNPGLSVFDLKGEKLQFLAAEEPNNVDVIYGFPLSKTTKIDLAYAGCRGDNTLCLFQITPLGQLSPIAGGSQTLPEDFDIYGSCTYHRARDQKFFLFANSKKAQYLQFEIGALPNGTLTTTLVRSFKIGTGTQPEGCVVDDVNEVIFIGEEQVGLWKYSANPEDAGTGSGILVDSVDKLKGGKMDADVEGMAMVSGTTRSEGYIIVSMQGVSAYNVYERKAPHKFVRRFSIVKDEKNGIDGVTNTDGVAAVGTGLGGVFGKGLIVVHDDANERNEGGTDANASFKLVSLGDALAGLGGVDYSWDPRA